MKVVHVVNDLTELLESNDILFSSIRDMLSDIGGLDLQHMRRHANSVAHNLARFVFSISRPYTWTFVDFLQWLQGLYLKTYNFNVFVFLQNKCVEKIYKTLSYI